MRFLSLFAGIGGFDLGLERAGWTCVGQCEIDPFCRAVLAKHWPDVPRFNDIREIDPDSLPDHDAQVGGFPCQDISSAGKGAGIHAERSGLWWEWLRLIRARRPGRLLIENVPALRTRGADEVLGSLESLGYSCRPLVVGAWAVGAPHRRDRVWIVGDLADKRSGRRQATVQQSRNGDCKGGEREAGFAGSGGALGVADPIGTGWRPRSRVEGDEGCAGVGRGEPSGSGIVADASGAGLEGRRTRASGTGSQLAMSASSSGDGVADAASLVGRIGEPEQRRESSGRTAARWPSGPGERQHEWERPRLVESSVGVAADGLPRRLAGFARRNTLRSLGNAVVPQVVEAIGRAILTARKEPTQ